MLADETSLLDWRLRWLLAVNIVDMGQLLEVEIVRLDDLLLLLVLLLLVAISAYEVSFELNISTEDGRHLHRVELNMRLIEIRLAIR